MNPIAIDTDAFLNARISSTYQFPDGAANNDIASWWRLNHPTPGVSWHLSYTGPQPGGPAVVDDFGDLVLAQQGAIAVAPALPAYTFIATGARGRVVCERTVHAADMFAAVQQFWVDLTAAQVADTLLFECVTLPPALA